MKEDDKTGFTIIEVVLVLGIAGLIFLMFLIALPALQALQRDSAREENISKLIEAIKKYQTNSRGALPSDWSNNGVFYKQYLGDKLVDPAGEPYVFEVSVCEQEIAMNECDNPTTRENMAYLNSSSFSSDTRSNIYIVTQAMCANNESLGVVASSNVRKFAVLQRLERGGIYCEDA